MSNKDLLNNHLQTLQELNSTRSRFASETKHAEREHIDRRKQLDDLREAEKQFYNS